MPWGWECRAKHIKQLPSKPTERRRTSHSTKSPAPNHYELPQIFCGKGFSKVKRAPAFTFGHLTKSNLTKPVTTPYAPMFDIQGLGRQGPYKITHSVVSPQVAHVEDRVKIPGPGSYAPKFSIQYKRPPAYSLRAPARPQYEPWDQWTPPPNMYCPPIPYKKSPAYSLGYTAKDCKTQNLPGPGEHDPKFDYVKRNKPAYSFGAPFKSLVPPKTPTPNTYCEKK
ncbi:adhesive plaque matrix protein-like, partial [Bombyx mandarina]|uniref:Adhesive plaque matrix protein-like n=1 Tax=Bombyx mandarina TaxID=7092 RepID=A0A6J2KJG9_BOMMA